MLNKKHNLKSGNSKDKKRDLKEKQDRKPQKRKNIDQEKIAIEYFDVVPFMKQKQRRKKRKERDKNKNQKKAKKKDKKEEKRTRTRERQRKRNRKRGRPKKAKEKQRETLKNQQKMPFSKGKQGFLCIKQQRKERKKQNKRPKKQKIINKEGLGPSEVALRATSPDP